MIEAAALVGVDKIDAGRLDFSEHFFLANAGRVDIHEREYFGSAVLIHSDRFHTENLNGPSKECFISEFEGADNVIRQSGTEQGRGLCYLELPKPLRGEL